MTTMDENETPPDLHPMWTDHSERAQAIADLADQIAGTDPPEETYLNKAARLNSARHQAEEMIRAQEHDEHQHSDDSGN